MAGKHANALAHRLIGGLAVVQGRPRSKTVADFVVSIPEVTEMRQGGTALPHSLSAWQKHAIDDMNDAVGLVHICNADTVGVSAFVKDVDSP